MTVVVVLIRPFDENVSRLEIADRKVRAAADLLPTGEFSENIVIFVQRHLAVAARIIDLRIFSAVCKRSSDESQAYVGLFISARLVVLDRSAVGAAEITSDRVCFRLFAI